MKTAAPDPRRGIPQVDRLVRELETAAGGVPRAVVVDAARAAVSRARAGTVEPGAVLPDALRELDLRRNRMLRPVLNATGVVLHTNLGRAPMHPRAVQAVVRIASGYSNLELDLRDGRRGNRHDHVEPLLALATGAEAALVVNNNAAAVMLVCAALAAGREVVISRGELIEIGGQFRIPEVLAVSGAILREVGTTNRTHLRDYEAAIGESTGLVLKVHPSNYRVVGFTAAPDAPSLAGLARSRGVPLVHDIGSGLLGEPLADEPEAGQALRDGADLVCFSGDKLLGGPQAGIVVGRAGLVSRLRSHPLVRALRPDKMALAALGETVSVYLDGSRDELPVWRMMAATGPVLEQRCMHLAERLTGAGLAATVVSGSSVAGGGSLPGQSLPGPVVSVDPGGGGADAMAAALRAADPPVVARIVGDAVILDLRTVEPSEDEHLADAVAACGRPWP